LTPRPLAANPVHDLKSWRPTLETELRLDGASLSRFRLANQRIGFGFGAGAPKIAEAFGVREDTVRLWRSDFTAGLSRR